MRQELLDILKHLRAVQLYDSELDAAIERVKILIAKTHRPSYQFVSTKEGASCLQ